MEFTMKTEDLKNVINKVKNTFGNKNLLALNNIYFEVDANGNGIAKSSTAHETTTTKFQARVTTDGKGLIDGFTLTKIINTFSDGDILIKSMPNGFGVEVSHPDGEIEIAGADPDDFINPATVSEQSTFMIPASELKDIVKAVGFAKAKDHANPKLNGVAFIIENGKAFVLASDQTRVAKYSFDTPAAEDINVVLDPDSLKGLSVVEGNISVKLASNGVLFETNETTFQGSVLTQGFPDAVKKYFVLPEVATVKIPKQKLLDALERVSILSKASKDDPHAELECDSSGSLEIKYKSTRGRIKSEKLSTTHTGQDVTLKVNTTKVLEAIKKIEKDYVEFVFPSGNGGVRAVTIFPEGDRDYGVFNMGVSS